MIHCYYKIIKTERIKKREIRSKPESYYRNILVKYLHKYSEDCGIGHLIFEKEPEVTDPDDETSGFLDIKVLNVGLLSRLLKYQTLKHDENSYFTFECKRFDKSVGAAKYITEGILRFIKGQYSTNMHFAGMIGFIETGTPERKVRDINKGLKLNSLIKTIQNLKNIIISDKFNYSYKSQHKREKGLCNIDLYHLMFNYKDIIV